MGLGLSDGTSGCKGLVDLLIQFLTVCDDQEGPVPFEFTEDLLAEKNHGETFTTALGVPEDPEPTLVVLDGSYGLYSPVNTEILMVLGYLLGEASTGLFEHREVFNQVKEVVRSASTTDGRLKGYDTHPVCHHGLRN